MGCIDIINGLAKRGSCLKLKFGSTSLLLRGYKALAATVPIEDAKFEIQFIDLPIQNHKTDLNVDHIPDSKFLHRVNQC